MDSPTGPSPGAPAQRPVLAAFTAAVFVSALLLFAVQPMFTRMVLPRLGGSPSVWSVAMVFFQTMLLAGYAYAHVLTRRAGPKLAVGLHLALLIVAALTLPLSISSSWGDPPAGLAALWLLGLFAVSIGLPFFALSANNPLLQAWFARTGHRDAGNPYFLYAASNIGSFLALLSYPFLLEPALTLKAHNWLWTAGFVALIGLIAWCGTILLRSPPVTSAEAPLAVTPPPTWRSIGRWVFLSAVPSGLLVAVTAHVSTDVAAAPLLWVIPLSLYLLTWVLVFQSRPLLRHSWMLWLHPVAIIGLVALLANNDVSSLPLTLGGHLTAFFIIAMACHGELAGSRPAADHLTTFYVSLSFGGMVGGLFAGLVAPFVFNWIAEYPILIALAVLCRPWRALTWNGFDGLFWGVAATLAAVLLTASLAFGWRPPDDWSNVSFYVVVAISALALLLPHEPLKGAVAVALALTMVHLSRFEEGRFQSLRSFFGVYKIYDTNEGQYRVLTHGTTMHGAQQIADENGNPIAGRPKPLTYYHENSPMAQSIRAIRARKGGPIRVAVIGLGSGSLACYVEPGEAWKFFEIDPLVVKFSRDEPRFTFIKDCAPDVPIVVGDARLTLTHEPDAAYDLIIVDAYTSDAIPIHLATREAMALYVKKLAPDGAVVMHISNRHLELSDMVVGIADANGLKSWHFNREEPDDKDDQYVFSSEVVISARRPEDIGKLATDQGWELTPPNPAHRVWSDDYSNILGAVLARYWR